ncbi:hypothetical protein E8K88_02565 [Lampropedia aestuarii]|uniref:Entry exclusion lipoprotein TrbK n=1 Tax=Lampropedia aestuarii TaxID=2562762 RepID=A0A4S5BUQ4_9BURK|nr:hypothetical protein E8K88_02565 [Lampropedia aestuarii]
MHAKILAPLAIALLVSACSSPQPTWRKASVTPDDTKSALAQCKYDVGLSKVAEAKEQELVRSCMESKGFRWVTY